MSRFQDDITEVAKPRYVPRPEASAIPTAAWNDAPLYCLKVNDQWVSHILGVLEALDQSDTWIGSDEEINDARQNVAQIMAALMTACPPQVYSFWDEPTPAVIGADDSDAVEVGVKFRTSVAGNVLGLRFYKAASCTGLHIGNLFTDAADLLGSFEFTDESADGWQAGYFATPIPILACELFVAAVHMPDGHYSYDRPFFNAEFASPPLYAPESSEAIIGNGVYSYGPAGTFPNNTYETTNYYVDVIFEPTGADYLE